MTRHWLNSRAGGLSQYMRQGGIVLLVCACCLIFGCGGSTTTTPDQNGDPIIVAWLETFGSDKNLGATIDGSGSWSTEGAVTYDYDMDGDGTYDVLAGDSVETWIYPKAGQYTVILRVTDPKGNSATDTAKATAVDETGGSDGGDGSGDGGGDPVDETPVAKLNIYWAEGGNAFRTLDATSSWAKDGGNLSYDYDIDGDGNYEIKNGQKSLVYEYPKPGEYTTVLRVTDSKGNSATASFTETIQPDDPNAWDPSDLAPVVKLQAYWAEGGDEYRTIDAQSSWARTGDDLVYDYDMNNDGTFEIKGGEPVFVHHFPGPGSYRIWLRVTDESGNSGTTSIVVEV